MKLLIVGATGRTGHWILRAALARGHDVTCLLRSTSRFSGFGSNVRTLVGDVENPSSLPSRPFDAVVSALDSCSVAKGTCNLVRFMSQTRTSRFIGISSGGILQLNEGQLRRDKPGYPELFRQSSQDHLQAWKTLENSEVNWTLICTPDILDEAAHGDIVITADSMPSGRKFVRAGNIADFIMNELERESFPCRRVGLAAMR